MGDTIKVNILVIVYGCLGRSLHITNKNHLKKIFGVLDENKTKYQTCYINNNIKEIDGYTTDFTFEDLPNVLNADFRNTFEQHEIDFAIIKHYPNYKDLFRKPPVGPCDYVKKHGLNPYRNSYLETMVSEFIRSKKENFSHTLAFCSDLWFDREFDLNWVKSNVVYVSDFNPAQGYTNGFYFGKSEDVGNLLNSFYNLDILAKKDYEYIIKKNSELQSIQIEETDYRFLKIRADGSPAYKPNSKIRNPKIRRDMRELWNKVKHIQF